MSHANFRKPVIILSLLSFFTINAFATNYYVSNSGDDGKNGLTEANAWLTLSKVSSIALQPGDSVFLHAGSIWREVLYVDAGSVSAYVYYGRYGMGQNPRIVGSEQALHWVETASGSKVWQSSETFVDPRGYYPSELFFVNNDSTTWGDFQSYDASFANLTKEFDWTYNSSTVYVYSTTNPSEIYQSVEVPQRDRAISTTSNSASYIEIDGVDMLYAKRWGYYCGYPAAKGATDLVFKNLRIAYIGYKGGASSYGIAAYHSNFLVDRCTITDCGRRGISYNLYTAPASGAERYIHNVVIRNSVFKRGQHTTALDLAAEAVCVGDTIVDVYFYNNRVDDHELTMTGEDKTSNQIYVQQGTAAYFNRIYIYNNVFIHATARNILINAADTVSIWNNTVVGHNPNITTNPYGNVVLTSSKVDYRNNITYDDLPDDSRDNYGVLMEHTNASFIGRDYNLYYQQNENTANPDRGFTGGYHGYYSTSEWLAYRTRNASFDGNSPTPVDPAFIGYTNYDFRLSGVSTAIAGGTPIPMVTYDIRGNLRDTENPCIGAYEYQLTDEIRENASINDTTFRADNTGCLDAVQNLVIAENGNAVTFESGNTMELIAGNSIQLMPGTIIQPGASVHAHITINNSFCTPANVRAPFAVPIYAEDRIEIHKEESTLEGDSPRLVAYPTINNGTFILEILGLNSGAEVLVFSAQGKEVMQFWLSEEKTLVDISSLTTGLYILKVKESKTPLHTRVIKM